MSGNEELAVEVCSGPFDGTGIRVTGGSFTVGFDHDADVSLPEATGTPESATLRYWVDSGGRLSLKADREVEFDGATTSEIESEPTPVFLRVGATDLALAPGGEEEEAGAKAEDDQAQGGAGGGGAPARPTTKCPICDKENDPGARWCGGCGRDLQ